jgi:hypothetical protein
VTHVRITVDISCVTWVRVLQLHSLVHYKELVECQPKTERESLPVLISGYVVLPLVHSYTLRPLRDTLNSGFTEYARQGFSFDTFKNVYAIARWSQRILGHHSSIIVVLRRNEKKIRITRCRGVGIRFPVGTRDLSLLHNVQAGSRAHPASCTMGAGSCFPGGKAAWV